jgi:hypothetical protein
MNRGRYRRTVPDDPQAAKTPTVGDVFASRLRAFRKARDLSVPALAAKCAGLGVPELTVPSITDWNAPPLPPSTPQGHR